jgi:hypothetical protein
VGDARKKKQRFLAANSYCCFCGGNEIATSVDHVPPRTCFVERAAPEGFEFPACDRCQGATRLDELAFGMFVRLSDPSDENYRSAEVQKIVQGIRNNLPHLSPIVGLSTIDRRRALRAKGLTVPPGKTVAEIPMVGFPPAIDAYIHRYARKLAAALYYKEKGNPIGLDFVIWTGWTAATDKRQMEGYLQVAAMSPFRTVGTRINLNFGDRFGYKCDKADDNDLFTAVAQFGQGLVIAMLVADGESAIEIDEDGWVRASAMFD